MTRLVRDQNLGKLKQGSLGFITEFRQFAMKGNVVDMAVGIIIGAAFGKIVSSLVADVIMPPIGLLMGGVNFADLAITLKAATATAPAVTVKYGLFIQTVLDFTIVAGAVFMMVKGRSRLKRKEEAKAVEAPVVVEIPAEQKLLTEIRDLLSRNAKA